MDKASWFIAGVACGAVTIWLLWISSLLTPRERRYLLSDDKKKDVFVVPPVKLDADQIATIKAEFQAMYTGMRNAAREESKE